MLPFLNSKKKQDGGSSDTVSINVDGKINAPSSEENLGLMAAAEDLVHAIHNKDHKAVAEALRNAMACLDD